MKEMLWGIGVYLVVVNIITYICFWVDKYRARHNHTRKRIPEDSLFGLAILGGSIGAWLAMYTLHHKTHHPKFTYGIPFILLLQIAGVVWALYYFSVID